MPNRNYLSGRRAEYAARRLLQLSGYTVVRAAGSKGPIDLVAWNESELRLIQIKSGRKPISQKEIDVLWQLPAPPGASVEVWSFRHGEWSKTLISITLPNSDHCAGRDSYFVVDTPAAG